MIAILDQLWTYGGAFVVTITVIVFFHELGHYLVARRNGVRIEVFSIGFGRELFGWTDRTGTRWKISMLPLGGYVKMFGQSDTGPDAPDLEMTEEEKAVAFPHKRVMQRFAIVLGGPLANFVLAIVLFSAVFTFVGRSETLPEATQVLPNSAAAHAGIKPGDLIVAVNGTHIDRFSDLQYIVSTSPGEPLKIEIERGGRHLTVTAVPKSVTETDALGDKHRIGLLGIKTDKVVFKPVPPLQAIGAGFQETFAWTTRIFSFLGKVLGGSQSSSELAGPLGIAQMSGAVAAHGLPDLVMFMAILSVNLGLINLFPIPMLDGGHLLFYVIEAIRGRPLSERAQEYGFYVGMGLVGALFVFVTFNDLARIGLVGFLSRLVS